MNFSTVTPASGATASAAVPRNGATNTRAAAKTNGATSNVVRPPKRSAQAEHRARQERLLAESAAKGCESFEVGSMTRTPKHVDHHETFDAIFGTLQSQMSNLQDLAPMLSAPAPQSREDAKQIRLSQLNDNIAKLMNEEESWVARVKVKGDAAAIEQRELDNVRKFIQGLLDKRFKLLSEGDEDESKTAEDDMARKNLFNEFDGEEA